MLTMTMRQREGKIHTIVAPLSLSVTQENVGRPEHSGET